MRARWHILVVDDEEAMTESLAAWLREDGYTVDTASSGREAIEKARAREYAIYFVDLKMPGGLDGIETMMEIRKLQKEASVIIITAYATVDTAIAAMKEGAQEYVVKPCHPQEISLLVERIIRVKNLAARERDPAAEAHAPVPLPRPGEQEPAHGRDLRPRAGGREPALDRAHPGRERHRQGAGGPRHPLLGRRGERPFVAVNCAALPETLLESELFGHEKGAFTGAIAQKKGKFELADGGTIFLDEIGDISPKLQVNLLRVLQERRLLPGGRHHGDRGRRAGHRRHQPGPRRGRCGEGRFREDLFYRLNVIGIHIPPLRERSEDIPLLAQQFVERLAHELGREVSGISEEALRLLMDHAWPGNVRELENAVERALVTCKSGVLGASDFAFLSRAAGAPGGASSLPPGLTLQEMEKDYIAATLGRLQGNVKAAAEALGIDRSTLYEKIKRYEIPR